MREYLIFISYFLSSCQIGMILSSNGSNILKNGGDQKFMRSIPEMPVPQLIEYWGYDVEEHFVTTEDGYILGLHRIPRGRHEERTGVMKPVAYLQHGLTSSSVSWTWGPPEKSIGYLLADAGYDVWMGNSRGNTYSRNHTYLEACSFERCKDFWNFGWHEGGLFDVTAGIDYALMTTGQSQVHYVGHSMGCTQFLVAMSMLPEYNNKIKVAALLAPPAFMSHATSPIFQIADLAGDVDALYHLFGLYEFLPHMDIISAIGHLFCADEHPDFMDVCFNIAFNILGYNPDHFNTSMISTYLDHLPEGTSTRPFVHYAQLYVSHNFEAYDFGAEENLIQYGQTTPPEYDLSQILAPVAIFKGDADVLVNVSDVDKLVNHLSNVVMNYIIEEDDWTHGCYVWGKTVDQFLYPKLLEALEYKSK